MRELITEMTEPVVNIGNDDFAVDTTGQPDVTGL